MAVQRDLQPVARPGAGETAKAGEFPWERGGPAPPGGLPASFGLHAKGLQDRALGAESRAAVGRRARGPGGGQAGVVGGIRGLESSARLSEEGQARAAGRGATLAGRGGPRAASPEGSQVAWGVGATGGCAGVGPESKGDG